MGKQAPKAPEPIDPTKTIAAQQQSNEASARLQQQLGMTGTVGPGGSVRYVANPNSPSGYDQVTDLSPEQRAIYDAQTAAQRGALDTANTQLGRINTALGRTLDLPTMQDTFDPGGRVQTRFNQGPGPRYSFDQGGQVQTSVDGGDPLQRGFNLGQAVQGQVGPSDFSADGRAVRDATFANAREMLDPVWNQAEDKQRVRLSNQGLGANSTATQTADLNFNRAKSAAYNDAAYRAIGAGADEQQRLFGNQVTQGQFANQAAGQQYAQNMGAANFGNDAELADFQRRLASGEFANEATGQQYDRNLGAAQFFNEGADQAFAQNMGAAGFSNQAVGQRYNQNMGAANFSNAARQQGFQNQAYSQNLPIDQFTQLMGAGGGVQMPTAYNGPVAGVAPTDALGSYALYDQGRQNNYNQRMANVRSKNQAIGSLGGAVLGNWGDIFGR